MRVLRPGDVEASTTKAMVGDLQNSATALKKQMESMLAQFATGTRLPKTNVVLGSGGPQGGISSTVEFLIRGGTLTNLKRFGPAPWAETNS